MHILCSRLSFSARLIALALCLLFMSLWVDSTQAETLVGYTQEFVPNVVASLEGVNRDLVKRDPVFQEDTIHTEAQGTVTLEFWDGSVLSMSSESQVVLSDIVYDPQSATPSRLTISLLVGTLRFVSGETADPDDDRIKIQTPFGFLGIRGTDLAVSVNDERVEMAVFEGGPMYFTDLVGKRRRLLAGRFLRFRRGGKQEMEDAIPGSFRKRFEKLAIDRNATLQFASEALGQRFGPGTRRRALVALREWYKRRANLSNEDSPNTLRDRRQRRRERFTRP